MEKEPTQSIAQVTDYPEVCILFQDQTITELFAELIRGRGVRTKVITSLSELDPRSKLVTEPQYAPLLSEGIKFRPLLVGNTEAFDGISSFFLSRPLTEEKIERALGEFLGA